MSNQVLDLSVIMSIKYTAASFIQLNCIMHAKEKNTHVMNKYLLVSIIFKYIANQIILIHKIAYVTRNLQFLGANNIRCEHKLYSVLFSNLLLHLLHFRVFYDADICFAIHNFVCRLSNILYFLSLLLKQCT